jgi:hypothetical protein
MKLPLEKSILKLPAVGAVKPQRSQSLSASKALFAEMR